MTPDELYRILTRWECHSITQIEHYMRVLRREEGRYCGNGDYRESIRKTIAYVRKHAKRLGWTIPHVSGRDDRVYFVVDLTADKFYEGNDLRRDSANSGTEICLQRIKSQADNNKTALQMIVDYIEVRPAAKEGARRIISMLDTYANHIELVLAEIRKSA